MVVSVPPCTRFPTPSKKGPGEPDRASRKYWTTTVRLALVTVLLTTLAAAQEGGGVVMTTLAIEFAVHFAIAVGGRVQGGTQATALF